VTSPGRILPSDAANASSQVGLTYYNLTLPEEATLFFNNVDPVLSDKTLRLILSESLDREQILNSAEGGQGIVVDQPLLPGTLGYTNQYAPPALSRSAAMAALTADGWLQAKPGAVRVKNAQQLKFTIVTLSGSEMQSAALQVQKQWAPLGIRIHVDATDETNLQQTYMRPRNFQMLLYGINLGADPDVYAFWHSSQAQDPGVNLSQYNDPTADKALESGRISNNPVTRTEKYHEFLAAWDADAPAAVLYQVGYTYATSDTVQGILAKHLITPSDRFYDVQRWTVRSRDESLF
jgi:peptide/nickel transport system substrate-binding protein